MLCYGVKVKCMEYAVEGKNSFRLPHSDDLIWYTFNNILCQINLPKPNGCRIIGLEIDNFTKPKKLNSNDN